jgi:glycosyltransferase involved in cell wall biosynthesis
MAELVVAIPTYRRPEALSAALAATVPQIEEMNADPEARFRGSVLVVDNDANATGRGVAESFGVRYVVESTPGIAAVRNRSLAECAAADAVVFIDDDEVPEPGWLAALVAMYDRTGAAAVAGRVLTRFPDDTEPWVRASGAFIRPVREDGQSMREAATNNLLLDLSQIRSLGLSFDERFGLTGGSDSMFTRELTRRGGTIRWAQAAVVIEQEEAARFTRSWVLMRTFRFGNTAGRVELALADSGGARAAIRVKNIARGGIRVVGGGARWLWGAVTGSLRHRARGLRTAYRGAGMIAASSGYAHDEYGRRRRKA